MGKTLSFGKGKGHIAHNNREYSTPNVDQERTKDNIVYKQEPIEMAYEKCFGKAIEDYNARQKRSDRKKTVQGYMDEIKRNQSNRNGEKLFYEQVVGVGDMHDSGILTHPEEAEKCKQVLDTYMKEWEKRNPNLYVFNATLHMDEATPHLHIDYIPVGEGYKQGIQTRNSLTKAFDNMGIESAKSKEDNATIKWQQRERERITEIAKEHGIEIDVLGIKRDDYSLSDYKVLTHDEKQALKQIQPVEPKRINLPFGMALEINREAVDQELERKANVKKHAETYKQATKEAHNVTEHVTEGLKTVKQMELTLEQKIAEVAEERESFSRYQKGEEAVYNKMNSELQQKKNELDTLIAEQKDINNVLNQVRQERDQALKERDELKVEITDVKTRLSEALKHIIELRKNAEKADKELETVKESFKTKLDNMAQSLSAMGSAFNYVKNNFMVGSSRDYADGAINYAKKWLKEDGFEHYAKDISPKLSTGMEKEIEKVKERDRGRGR